MNSATETQTSTAGYLYGDVSCLNCGRLLAAAVRRLRDGATAIRPLRRGEEMGVEIRNERSLRCTRCGGRAFIEFDDAAAPRRESADTVRVA